LHDYNYIAPSVFSELERSSEIRIIYVPSHLYHMLFELFKNSMRAVMEHHGSDSDNYPPLEVLLVRGKEDICVKVGRKIVSSVAQFLEYDQIAMNNYRHFTYLL